MTTASQEPLNMNHPSAVEADWTAARENIHRAAVRAGFDQSTADDIAQNGAAKLMERQYRKTCPTTLERATRVLIATRRRYGWRDLMDRDQARQFRRDATETERAAEVATMAIYRERSGNMTPADMAAQAEAWGSLQRAAAIRTAVAHSLLDAVMAAQGIGPTACMHEVGHTPSIYGTGRPKRPPMQGARGLHTATDPVPGSHDRAADAPPVMIARRITGPGR